MRLKLVLMFIAIIIVLGGCQMPNKNPSTQTEGEQEELKPAAMNEEDLPDVRAFQDKFTRGFLQSTEETRPGYYPFLSGTELFTMDFPGEGSISEKAYALKENEYEGLSIGVGNENSNITASINITYHSYLTEQSTNYIFGQIQSNIGRELNFEEIKKNEQTLYIAPYENDFDEGEFVTYGYVGYIQNNKDSGGIKFIYTSHCEERCDELKEDDMKSAHDLIKSIDFIGKTKEDDQDDG